MYVCVPVGLNFSRVRAYFH